MPEDVPPRGPALTGLRMLVAFDVDCGELVAGHRFIARGLSGPIALPLPDDWHIDPDGAADDEVEDEEPEAWRRRRLQERAAFAGQDSYPGFALEYEIVPGVPADSSPRGIWGYLVGISYDADVPLPWEPCDGGAVAPAEGGASTHGSRGDWPLPPDARVLTFTLYAVGDDGFQCEDDAGDLVVDLSAPTAEWRPAAPVP